MGKFLGIALLTGELLFYCVLPILGSLVKATAKQMEIKKCQDDGKLIFEGNQNGLYSAQKIWTEDQIMLFLWCYILMFWCLFFLDST